VTTSSHRDRRAGEKGASSTNPTSNLVQRIASAAVLAPMTIGAAYVGGWLFLVLCAAAAGGILWEWTQLASGRADLRILAPGLAGLLAALVLVAASRPTAAAGMIAIGAILAGVMVALQPPRQAGPGGAAWAAAGVVYAGVAFLSPALLRRDAQLGFAAIVFLAATVWMTDTFAYMVGRTVGGPLLWARVSPNKTWSGAIGGLAGGVAGGTLVAYASGVGRLAVVGVIALTLSVLAQAGDLLESAVKRRFGAKDASHIIPGHGGLMDRLDGFLAAALAALLIGILRHGTDAPAQGLLAW
jgi:phosphatidate cytidylyltransferase